ncbi:hypothetical protein FG386_002996 [Cryptosporidium ryanae]|uniref:uncharacterized protein n=1 Tax=Cryptosporidium ryanae TaxID=515981 RepID=UPI00351A114B|nr:hypothetical protein FG386_002996 [Cryptosporidium ryanae]
MGYRGDIFFLNCLFLGVVLLIFTPGLIEKSIQVRNYAENDYPLVLAGDSLLKLREEGVDNSGNGRVPRTIDVLECSPELFLAIQLADYRSSFFLRALLCAVQKIEEILKSCARKCKLLRLLTCKCKGISDRLQKVKEKLNEYKLEHTKWNDRLMFCIECRVLTQYLLESGKRTGSRSEEMLSAAPYVKSEQDIENIKQKLVKMETFSNKISYLNQNISLLNGFVKELCLFDKYACTCAKKILKNDIKEKKMMIESIKDSAQYVKKWYNQNSGGLVLGRSFEKIKRECSEKMDQVASSTHQDTSEDKIGSNETKF